MNRKFGCVFFKYAYGDRSRGYGIEYQGLYQGLRQAAGDVCALWIDEFRDDQERLREKALDFVKDEKPDVIFFVLMKDEFSLATLDELRRHCVTVNWFCDDYWRFDDFTAHYAPYFSFAVTTDKYYLKKYGGINYRKVILSQWAAIKAAGDFQPDGVDYRYDVSFVGMKSDYREWLVKRLRKNGFSVVCFGYGWDEGVVTYERMEEIFRTSRVNLNISNSVCHDVRCLAASPRSLKRFVGSRMMGGKKTAESVKARNFEIPAAGGFQLTLYVPGLEDFYTVGREIAVYADPDTLCRQLEYYLTHADERKAIALNGHARTRREHLYVHRFKGIIKQIFPDGS